MQTSEVCPKLIQPATGRDDPNLLRTRSCGILASPRSHLGRRREKRGRKREEGRGCLEKKQKVEDRKKEEEWDRGGKEGN